MILNRVERLRGGGLPIVGLISALLFLPSICFAEVYRCVAQDGKTTFSDFPCGVEAQVIPSESTTAMRATNPASGPVLTSPGQSHVNATLQRIALQCEVSDYNSWLASQHPTPSSEQILAKLNEVKQKCRALLPFPRTSPNDSPNPPPPDVHSSTIVQVTPPSQAPQQLSPTTNAARHTDPVQYKFTVSGNWSNFNGTPFGMPLSPTLSGTITVDSSLHGFAAVKDFKLITGSKTWTLADYVGVYGFAQFDYRGKLTRFHLPDFRYGKGTMFIDSHNSFAINSSVGLGNNSNGCDGCVSEISYYQELNADAPEEKSAISYSKTYPRRDEEYGRCHLTSFDFNVLGSTADYLVDPEKWILSPAYAGCTLSSEAIFMIDRSQ